MSQAHFVKGLEHPEQGEAPRFGTIDAKKYRFFKPSCVICLSFLIGFAGLSFWLNGLVNEAKLQADRAHALEDSVGLLNANMNMINDIQRTAEPAAADHSKELIEITLHRAMTRLETLPEEGFPSAVKRAVDHLKADFDRFHDAAHDIYQRQASESGAQSIPLATLIPIYQALASLSIESEAYHFESTQALVQLKPLAHLSLTATLTILAAIVMMQFRRHRAHIKALQDDRMILGQAHRDLSDAFDTTKTSLKTISNLFDKSASAARMTIFIQDCDLVFSWIHNPRFGGTAENIIGKSMADILPPDLAQKITAEQTKVIHTGKSNSFEFEFNKDGQHYFYLMQCDPLYEGDQVIGLIGMAKDITQQHERDKRIESLVTEMVHRRQNMVSVINAMMRQTLRSSATEQEFEEKFSGRLMALGRSLSFLTSQKWKSVCICELINTHLMAIDNDLATRIITDGSSVLLLPRIAEALGDALHELIDNAKRHGALSQKHGQVKLSWIIDQGSGDMSVLRLAWKEDDHTLVIPAIKQEGYGLTVLKKIIPRLLNGDSDLTFARGGITWTMAIPLLSPDAQAQDEAFVI